MTGEGAAATGMWKKALVLALSLVATFALVTNLDRLGFMTGSPVVAPDFDLPRLGAPADEPGRATLAQFRGRPVLIHFWASWCAQCKSERPLFRVLGDQAKATPWRGAMLGISTADELAPAEAEVAHLAPAYPMAFDAGDEVSKRYAIKALPHTLLIDAEGRIVKRYARALTTEDLPTIIAHLR